MHDPANPHARCKLCTDRQHVSVQANQGNLDAELQAAAGPVDLDHNKVTCPASKQQK